MRTCLLLLAGLAIGFGGRPAFALKNVEGCDIVAFAAENAPISIAPERWRVYAAESQSLLASPPGESSSDWRGLARGLIGLQGTVLADVKASPAYQDYLAADTCRVLSRLESRAIEGLLHEVEQAEPDAIATLRGVTEAARTQIDRIERTARFTSNQAKTLMGAHYYCFVAGAIVGLLPSERRATIALEDFGETVTCQQAGRSP